MHSYLTLKQRRGEAYILAASVSILGVLVVVPLALLTLNSFRDVTIGEVGFILDRLSLDNYIKAYTDPKTLHVLGNSFVFATGSTVVAFILGGVMAFLVERTDAPWRRLSYGMMFVPLIVPGMLWAIGWLFLLSPNIGLINVAWRSIGFETPLFSAYSMAGMWWVQGINESTLAFLFLGAALRRMDPALEEAGVTSGASQRRIAAHITARLLLPAIASVILLNFVRGLEALEVPLILGLNAKITVFASAIMTSLQWQFPPAYGLGFTYSMTLIVLCVVGLWAYLKAVGRGEKYTVVTGKGYRPRTINLGRWKPLAAGFQLFFFVVVIGLPLLVLLWSSLLPTYLPPSREVLSQVSLDNYTKIFARPDTQLVLRNTAIVAAVTSVGVMFLSLLLSFIILHMKIKGGKVLDGLAFIPFAIPSISMGMAFMIMFLAFPNPFYGTIWILVIAYITRELPYGTRFTHAGLMQVHKELEEVAKTSGASFRSVLWHIIVPIMKPSLIGGALYAFIQSVKVFPIAALLWSPQSKVLSIDILTMWQEGYMGLVSALAVAMLAGISMLTLLGGGPRRMGKLGG
ncbi:MAG: iron ABC transporter permease [Chloroflexi bacterium]|nr:iron ABC transporter permease [Chloroflexota bacterium]